MDEQELQQYAAWSEDMYRFVMDIMDHMKKPHNYCGIVLNMVEMHTLSLIAEQPGISVGEVAKMWNRTMSAASRNVDRLHSKGYIEKKKEDGNAKTIHLYATATGQELAEKHREIDRQELQSFAQYFNEHCTKDDLEHFDRTMKIIHKFYVNLPE